MAERPAFRLALLAAGLAITAYLMVRLLGIYPHIFADEWYYSKMSRLQPLSESILPSWLYLWLFSASNACGTHFYDCVHAGNVLFYAGATPFVYLTARRLAGAPLAGLVALLSLLAPLNLYTAYFMPESMYYFGFWLLSWIVLTRSAWHYALLAGASGIVLGLMSLVKVHALFLLPALCVFLAYRCWSAAARWLAAAAASAALTVAGFFAVRIGIGYLLAGAAALNLFGSFYSGAANAASHSMLRLLAPGFVNARGHLMALAMLAPLPLASIAAFVLRPPARQQVDTADLLRAYTLLMLGAAVAMTVAFTASIANPGVTDEGLRLHQRYYSFTFPLLWLVAAATMGRAPGALHAWARWTIALLLLAVLGIALIKLPTYALNPVDGPDVFSVTPAAWYGQAVLVLDAAVLLLWAARQRYAGALFVYAALPFTLGCGLYTSQTEIDKTRTPTLAERVGAYAISHIPAPERKLITIAGTDLQQMMHLQFVLDNPDSTLLQLDDAEGRIEQYQLPVRKTWLVVLGEHPLPASIHSPYRGDGFALAQVTPHHRRVGYAALSAPFGTGLISAAEGMSSAEPWGRWSDAGKVVLHFNSALPRHLRVILHARAYDVNTTQPFTMHVGDQSARFRLGWSPSDIGLSFETDGKQRELVIDVPHPVAPLERGQLDPRKLGIGIANIEIGEASGADLAAN